jgi:fructosamine-3-kinase
LIDLQPDLELSTDEAERVLAAWSGGPTTCSRVIPLKGGLVNSVFRLEFDRSPFRAVVKLHGTDGDSFAEEATALDYLAAETSCPVPRVLLHDGSGRVVPHAFLLLENVAGVCLQGLELEPAERAAIDVELAGVLSELHRHHGERWGRPGSGHGASSWSDVVTSRLAEVRAADGLAVRLTPETLAVVDEAIALAGPALADAGQPTLVHGDVWDGNLMVEQENGRRRISGLLDPNLQFADVELELAYLEVFDNRRDAFFAAYTEVHPLRPGYEWRRLFYWLHTALLHVALFDEEFFREFTARTAATITGRSPGAS